MVKSVIIIIESPLNKRDFQRFGIEIMRENGFNAEVWDISHVLYPGLDLTPRDLFTFSGLRIFKDKQEVMDSILGLDTMAMVLLGLDYRYLRFFWIYQAISKSRAQYSVIQQYSPAAYCGSRESLVSRFSRLFIGRSVRTCFIHVRDKLFSVIPPRFLGIKPPVYWFAGTDRALEFYSFPKGHATKVVYIHSFDYDLFLEKGIDNTRKFPANAVFLDSYLPFHEDDKMVGVSHGVTATRYYPSLCRFFDYAEKKCNIPVDIAVHPRSFYEKHPDYFGKRTLRIGQTIECVKDAKFVIAHDSTAVNFAVIYNKPVVFIVTQEMIRNYSAAMVYMMASWFGKLPINIDQPLDVNWVEELSVNKERYEEFKNFFIKKRGTPEVNSWKIILFSFEKGLVLE